MPQDRIEVVNVDIPFPIFFAAANSRKPNQSVNDRLVELLTEGAKNL